MVEHGFEHHQKVASVNREVLRRINREVSLRASRFANTFLSGVFRAIFQIEKAYEFAEPEVFGLDHEPDRMLWKRLDGYQLMYLPLAIANEDVLVSRYQLFTEYDFVIVADISQSMMLYWWGIYGGQPLPGQDTDSITNDMETRRWKIPGDKTKLFLMKYTLSSFLHAAKTNEFSSCVLLAGGDRVTIYNSRQEPNLEEAVLGYIDEHYERQVSCGMEEHPFIIQALRQVLARRRRAIVLCISDFMDTLQCINDRHAPRVSISAIMSPLVEISACHRLLVLQVNDRRELEPQEGEGRFDLKNCPYLNGEIHIKERDYAVGNKDLENYAQRVKDWNNSLHMGFDNFGVKWQHLKADQDDENIDARLYGLGMQSGR